MELYIARDKDGRLFLYYNYLPIRDDELDQFTACGNDIDICGDEIEIDSGLFPEVTWENSPRKVELKLI